MKEETKVITIRSHIPARLRELWSWFEAVYEWDWGDPNLLAALIHTEQIPSEFQIAIAEIVAGVRPRPKFWQSKVSAQHRLLIAQVSLDLAEFRHGILSDSEIIEDISNEEKIDPIDVIHNIQKAFRDEIETGVKQAPVGIETFENILRDFRSRIDRWPTV